MDKILFGMMKALWIIGYIYHLHPFTTSTGAGFCPFAVVQWGSVNRTEKKIMMAVFSPDDFKAHMLAFLSNCSVQSSGEIAGSFRVSSEHRIYIWSTELLNSGPPSGESLAAKMSGHITGGLPRPVARFTLTFVGRFRKKKHSKQTKRHSYCLKKIAWRVSKPKKMMESIESCKLSIQKSLRLQLFGLR